MLWGDVTHRSHRYSEGRNQTNRKRSTRGPYKEVEVMDTSFEQQALASDDALKIWEEVVEDVVTSAMGYRADTNGVADELQNPLLMDAEVEDPAMEDQSKEGSPNELWNDGSCVGEILIDRKVGPAHTFQVCLGLKSTLKSEIISIDHSDAGTTVRCTVPNPASLIGALGQFTGISSWALITA
jgi:hypothetical protein